MTTIQELPDLRHFLFILNIVIILIITAAQIITLRYTRKSFLFGVRVPADSASLPEVIAMKRRYIQTILIIGGAAAAVTAAQYLLWPAGTLLMCMYLPFLMLPAQFFAFVPRWRQAAALKAAKKWRLPTYQTADLRVSAEKERFSSIPKGWYLASLIFIGGLFLLTVIRYPALPDRLVTHWNINMQPDAWGDKSILTAAGLPLVCLLLWGTMLGSNIMIFRMKLQVNTENPARSYAQHRLYRRMMSHCLGFLTVIFVLFFALLQIMTLHIWIPPAIFLWLATGFMLVGSVAPFIYVSIKAGQSGNRLEVTVPAADSCAPIISRDDDDRFWKWGLFYVNPDDPAWVTEDRFGMNGNFNYGHRGMRWIVAAAAALIGGMYLIFTILFVNM